METLRHPTAETLQLAVEIYLRHAYDGSPPSAVRGRVETLAAAPASEVFQSPVFETSFVKPNQPRYSLRLGNRCYPHMKLVIDPAPDGHGYMLRADTHDRHVLPPPNSPEHALFRDLMAKNQAMADEIEGAWEAAGLKTFKSFLREDLARRTAAHPGSPTGADLPADPCDRS